MILLRGTNAQRLRLAAGLVLFAFVAAHFLNHAIGLVSVDAMVEVQSWRKFVTRSLAGTIVLGTALCVHIIFALVRLSQRSTPQMPLWEMVQIGTGLFIPIYLFPHIVATRFSHELFGVNDTYYYELIQLWPANAWTMSILLLVVWVHGCVGLHFWLRLTALYRKLTPVLFGLAVAIPVAGLAGFVTAAREAELETFDAESFDELKQVTNWPAPENHETLRMIADYAQKGFAVLLVLVALYILFRIVRELASSKVEVQYISGPTVRAPLGPTLLEISRMHNIPHASVCGGRARCSTCRVRFESGGEHLDPPNAAEAATLKSINAPAGVRLACQVRPTKGISVIRLLRPVDTSSRSVASSALDEQGVERELAVMFIDVRGFTRLSEHKLPYDTVYMLNEFFNRAGKAIREEGGWIDKYLGDGLMAVFGRESGHASGCRQALRAARTIDLSTDDYNAKLQSELGEPIKIGIGIHVGPMVLGRIGFDDSASMTVIGRTVNAASRLEALTKERGCQLIFSTAVAKCAGLSCENLDQSTVSVRGLTQPLDIIAMNQARELPHEQLIRSTTTPDITKSDAK